MATTTTTKTGRKGIPKGVKLAPENERYMRACADIASALIQDYEEQANGSGPKRDINLNALRGQISKKHYLGMQPPLTAIIAAVPEHYKKYILPKLIAKPISTICLRWGVTMSNSEPRNVIRNCRGCRDVQASSMSAYFLHGKYLCLLSRRTRFGF